MPTLLHRFGVGARLLVAACTAGAVWGSGGTEARAFSSDTGELQTAVEAWYSTPPEGASDPVGTVCVLAGDCAPFEDVPEPNPFPEHTLHVGAEAGEETARTYLGFDLADLPEGAVVTGGTMTLPIAGPDAGTVLADKATLQLCLATGRIKPVEGSIDPPPGIDCASASPVTVKAVETQDVPVDGAEDVGTVFVGTADLTPFAADLEGETTAGFAVVPADVPPEEQAAWHVAFHGREREAEDAKPITASFEYDVEAPDDEFEEEEEEPEDEEVVFEETDLALPTPFSDDFGVVVPDTEAAPVADLRDPTAAEPVASDGELVYRTFAYPAIFVLPLLLLALAWYFGRAFTTAPRTLDTGNGLRSP